MAFHRNESLDSKAIQSDPPSLGTAKCSLEEQISGEPEEGPTSQAGQAQARHHTFCLNGTPTNQVLKVCLAHRYVLMGFAVLLKAFGKSLGYLMLTDIPPRVSIDSEMLFLRCSWYLEKIAPPVLMDTQSTNWGRL